MTTSDLPSKFILTNEDFEEYAKSLGCSVDAISAEFRTGLSPQDNQILLPTSYFLLSEII